MAGVLGVLMLRGVRLAEPLLHDALDGQSPSSRRPFTSTSRRAAFRNQLARAKGMSSPGPTAASSKMATWVVLVLKRAWGASRPTSSRRTAPGPRI